MSASLPHTASKHTSRPPTDLHVRQAARAALRAAAADDEVLADDVGVVVLTRLRGGADLRARDIVSQTTFETVCGDSLFGVATFMG